MLLSHHSDYVLEAGTDEVGRGCLAGPVVAAAVIFPQGYENPELQDSKKLSKKVRLDLEERIKTDALTYAVAEASPEEIDQINILQASFLAMHRALEALSPQPEFILVDGNRFKPYQKIPFACMIKGDNRFLSIAAASILAKNHRDRFMEKLHEEEHPEYAWHTNVGYPTVAHRKAIQIHGITPYHRKSFRLLPNQELFDNKG